MWLQVLSCTFEALQFGSVYTSILSCSTVVLQGYVHQVDDAVAGAERQPIKLDFFSWGGREKGREVNEVRSGRLSDEPAGWKRGSMNSRLLRTPFSICCSSRAEMAWSCEDKQDSPGPNGAVSPVLLTLLGLWF